MASQAGGPPQAAEQAQRWLARMASGEFDQEDAEGLQAWLTEDEAHLGLLERERATWQALDALRHAFASPEAVTVAAVGRRRSRRSTGRRILAGVTATAACLAMALFLPSLLVWQADHRTGTTWSRLALDDGSVVVLDAASAIAVDYSTDRRRVRLLRGAAWFDVAHGDTRPFVVEARGGRVHDIGTAFSVQLGDDATYAHVASGEVEITGAGAARRLHAGQGAGYGNDGALFALPDTAPGDVAPWRHGEILFEDTPIEQALRELSRYRERPLWLVGNFSGAGKVTAVFSVEAPEEAIDTLVRMGHLKSRILPGGIRLIRH